MHRAEHDTQCTLTLARPVASASQATDDLTFRRRRPLTSKSAVVPCLPERSNDLLKVPGEVVCHAISR